MIHSLAKLMMEDYEAKLLRKLLNLLPGNGKYGRKRT